MTSFARRIPYTIIACCLVPAAAWAQCLADPVNRATLQYDFDYLFAGLDLTLGASFPQWLARYNQRNTTDPTPNFANEDNCQNGLNDDDHLALLAAVLDGNPVAEVMPGINAAQIANIRTDFAANRAKVRPDLTLQILFVTVNIIDEINKDDPAFGASLQDLVAAYMTIGDAQSVAFIRNLLITLGEIFIEQGVASGAIPGFVEGLVKDSLRNTVNANFVATRYACYGDAPGSTKPNLLGASGNIGGSADTNLAEYAAQGADRAAWLIAKGVAKPPLQILSAPGNTTVPAGTALDFALAIAGGDGGPVLRDWKTVNPLNGQTAPFSTEAALAFPYPLPSDSAVFAPFVCDGTWVRGAQPFTLTVNPAPFSILTQPVGGSRVTGEDYTFSVTVVGGDAPPTYQWQRGPNSSSLADIPGANGRTLTLANLQLGDAGLYRVVVTSGATTLESSRVGLVVNPAPDTTPPVVTLVGANPLVLECGTPFVDPGATAFDEVSGNLTGAIQATGTVDTAVPGSYTRTYTVADAAGNVGQATRTVTVVDTVAPLLALIGPDPIIVECGESFVDPGASANDACGGDLAAAVQASGSVNSAVPGSYTRTYIVSDAAGNTASLSRNVQVLDRIAPTITPIGPDPIIVECGEPFVDPGANANDACGGDLAAAVQASGSVNSAVPGIYTRTYIVTDASGNIATLSRNVQVLDRIAPTITPIGSDPIIVECGESFVDPGVTANDACGGNLAAAVQASGSVNSAVPGIYTRTYIVSDAAGNTATLSRNVQVLDRTAPTITLNGPDAITLECGDAFVDPGAAANDACGGDLAGAVVVEGAVDPKTPGVYTLAYRATDAAGNTATTVRTVTVADTLPPALALVGPDAITVECGGNFVDPGATATDACGGDLGGAITVAGAVDTGTVGGYTLTYRVEDAAGNAAELTRTVTVADTTPPVLSIVPPTITVECGAPFFDPGATMTDACDGEPETAFPGEGDVDTRLPGDYTLTYRVFDGAGNLAEETRTVRVLDRAAPVITLSGPAALSLSCGAEYVEAGATALDACDGDLTPFITLSGAVNPAAPGVYTLDYTVADAAGNTALRQRVVTVLNDCAIEITRQPASLRMYPGTTAVFLVAATGGAAPLTYTWLKDGEPLDIPSNPRLEIRGLDFDDAGRYRCVVGDGLDTVESAEAALEIFPRAESGRQSADLNGDWSLSLSELLRVIQLFNLGEFGCEPSAEDGYAPGATDRGCAPHDTDYNPQDWRFSLSELLRAIQFYNSPGGLYHRQPGTEDGLAPGAG